MHLIPTGGSIDPSVDPCIDILVDVMFMSLAVILFEKKATNPGGRQLPRRLPPRHMKLTISFQSATHLLLRRGLCSNPRSPYDMW